MMKIRAIKSLGSFIVLCLLFSFLPLSEAAEFTKLNLKEAIEISIQQNVNHSLFLWEQRLAEQREALKKQPQITVGVLPAQIENGQFEPATSSLTMDLPLGDHLDLSGTVIIAIDRSGVVVEPTASLDLGYKFFAPPQEIKQILSLEESRLIQSNLLVLEIVDIFIQLRNQLDLREYETENLSFLELSLEAARLTLDYDDLELKKDLRDQIVRLTKIEEDIKQLQLKLGVLLGVNGQFDYEPDFKIINLELDLSDEKFYEETFSFNSNLRQSQANLAKVQEKLALEYKTRGWDIQATGKIDLNLNWDMSLSANKKLYPRNIILEELELEVARAEYELARQESVLINELQGAMQAIENDLDQIRLKAEHLAETKEDLAFCHRQYEAGLATELQVKKATLLLREAELDYAKDQMHHVQSILALWHLCGRDLQSVVYDVIN